MSEQIDIEISGTRLRLLAEGGVYVVEQRMLLVADTHFGKEATFRFHSIPTPRGSTAATVHSISQMLVKTSAEKLGILGDMFHDSHSLSDDVVNTLDLFFAEYQHVAIELIKGNHDRSIKSLPSHWNVGVHSSHYVLDKLMLLHDPAQIPTGHRGGSLCGHWHPAVRLGSSHDRVKLPCFLLRKDCLVLPAIGEFTGSVAIRPATGDRAWMIVGSELVEWRRQNHELNRN